MAIGWAGHWSSQSASFSTHATKGRQWREAARTQHVRTRTRTHIAHTCARAPMNVTPYTLVITVCFTSLRSTCTEEGGWGGVGRCGWGGVGR